MAEKKKMYLDTSVPGAYYDDRSPEQRDVTRAFWRQLDKYDICTSTLVKDELNKLGEVYSIEIDRLQRWGGNLSKSFSIVKTFGCRREGISVKKGD